MRPLPPWSTASARSTAPAATAAPLPPEEPPAEKAGLRGLRTTAEGAGLAGAGESEIVHVELADDDRAGIQQALDHDRVHVGHVVLEQARAVGHRHAREPDVVLEADGPAGKPAGRPPDHPAAADEGVVRVLLGRQAPAGVALRIGARERRLRQLIEAVEHAPAPRPAGPRSRPPRRRSGACTPARRARGSGPRQAGG